VDEGRKEMTDKSEKWKLIFVVLSGLIGVYGATLSTCNSNRVDKNKAIQEETTKSLLTQINNLVIPRIQRDMDDIRYNLGELTNDSAAIRERLTRVETIMELLARRFQVKVAPPPVVKPRPQPKPPSEEKIGVFPASAFDFSVKKPQQIPMIQESLVLKQEGE